MPNPHTHHRETVPLSVIDGSDGDLVVEFDFYRGTPASGMSGPPENYDPGEGPEFYVTASCYESAPGIPVLLADHEVDKVTDWLLENWTPPDDGPDPDDWRDQRIDDRLTGDS